MKRWVPLLSVVAALAILISPLTIIPVLADEPMSGDFSGPGDGQPLPPSPDGQPVMSDEAVSPPPGPGVAPGGDDDSELIIAHIYRDTIRIPKALTDPVVLDISDGPRIELTKLGLSDSASDAVLQNADVAQYNNTATSTDTYIVGLRVNQLPAFGVFEVLNDASAPEVFRYHVTLPDGYTLSRSPSGGYNLVNAEGTVHAAVEPPWASDVNGKAVPVSYHYDGNGALELHVLHRVEATAYPIVVDPLLKKVKKTLLKIGKKAKQIASDAVAIATPIALTTVGVGTLTVVFVAGVAGAVTASPPLLLVAAGLVDPGRRITAAGIRGMTELRDRYRDRRRRYVARRQPRWLVA